MNRCSHLATRGKHTRKHPQCKKIPTHLPCLTRYYRAASICAVVRCECCVTYAGSLHQSNTQRLSIFITLPPGGICIKTSTLGEKTHPDEKHEWNCEVSGDIFSQEVEFLSPGGVCIKTSTLREKNSQPLEKHQWMCEEPSESFFIGSRIVDTWQTHGVSVNLLHLQMCAVN